MKNWMYNNIYIPLVDIRDRNHSKNGFTWKGYIIQFIVTIYSKLFI